MHIPQRVLLKRAPVKGAGLGPSFYRGYFGAGGFAINGGMDIPSLDELKAALGLFRTAIGLAKDSRDLLPDGKEKEVVTQTLDEAEKAAQIAEASIAQAFGYELCKCEFPPTPMLRIGY